jgi:hypothetical protein
LIAFAFQHDTKTLILNIALNTEWQVQYHHKAELLKVSDTQKKTELEQKDETRFTKRNMYVIYLIGG